MKLRKIYRIRGILAASVVLWTLGGAGSAHGQAVDLILTEFEGKITAIQPGAGPKGADILEVMGVRIVVQKGTPVSSPSMDDLRLVDMGRSFLPGRSDGGFVGGTAIVEAVTENGVTTAISIFMEPAENGLIGPITANEEGNLSILGIPLVMLQDQRMPSTIINCFGFEVSTGGTPIGAFAGAEGYLGNDGVFYAFIVEVEGDLVDNGPQTSITRARGVDEARIRILGASTTKKGIVTIYNDHTGALLGVAFIAADLKDPTSQFGTYSFQLNLGDGELSPRRIRVENTNGSFVIGDVDIR